jgi:hypothetical protein
MDIINCRIDFKGKNYIYIVKRNELFSSVIEKFKKDSGLVSGFRCIYNSKFIDDPNKTLEELDIKKNMTTIEVDTIFDVPGAGFSINFTDVSKNIHEEHYFSKTAPDYRIVSKGINVYGICKGKKCKAYNKEVICPLKNKKIFNLLDEKENLECPICGSLIIPKTLGFFSCEYRIKGKKCENDTITPFELRDKASNKDSIRYFNPDKNGKTMITELIVEVIKFL